MTALAAKFSVRQRPPPFKEFQDPALPNSRDTRTITAPTIPTTSPIVGSGAGTLELATPPPTAMHVLPIQKMPHQMSCAFVMPTILLPFLVAG